LIELLSHAAWLMADRRVGRTPALDLRLTLRMARGARGMHWSRPSRRNRLNGSHGMAWRGRLDGRPSEPRMADGRMWEQYTGPWEAAPARASKGLRPPRARQGARRPTAPGGTPPRSWWQGINESRPGSRRCGDQGPTSVATRAATGATEKQRRDS
jgi:hypothetical protein